MDEKEKIIEDLEITAATAGAAPVQLPGRVISIFPALAHRNFQLYFAGQALSLIGFWLHQVGIGYYVFQMTHSPFWVGATIAVFGLPFLLFTTIAGVLADRVDKKKLLISTQILDAVLAVLLGLAVINGVASLNVVLILTFLSGVAGAFNLPTRLAFIIEMVGGRDLASAVPINNGLFNAARFVGPALAGFLIATIGVGYTFIFNGLSYLQAIAAIFAIKPIKFRQRKDRSHPLVSLKLGVVYSFKHPQISCLILIAALTAVFIWPYATLMPVIAEKIFKVGPQGLGSLLSAAGAGSLVGAVFTSAMSKFKTKGYLVLFGIIVSSVNLILFALNDNFLIAHVLLFVAGFGLLTQVATVNTLIQIASPQHMRARIMGVYLTMFIGIIPFGNLLSGILAEKTSSLFTIGLGATVVLTCGILLYVRGVFSSLH